MLKTAMLTLIGESPEAHGVGEDPEETTRRVYCTLKSIGQQEAYLAMAQGLKLKPEKKAVLAHDFEYKGETLCELNGKRYRITRTYETETDDIELTLSRTIERGSDDSAE